MSLRHRRSRIHASLLTLLLSLLAGCGGGGGEPTGNNPPPTQQPAAVASVSVTLAATSVLVGGSTQATAELRSATGATLSGRTVAWSTSAPSVATVSSSGLVQALAAGTATITASSEGQSGTATLVVTAPVTVSFAQDSIDVQLRARAQLAPVVRDGSGTVVTGRTITYQSSAPTIVSVTSTGEVRALLPGVATITATVEGRSTTLKVNAALADLTRIVDSLRQAHGMPAMGAVIVHREGLIGLGVGGTRRATGGAVVTVNDKWHLGSNTKAMTGILAGMAVDAGVLSWSRTVEQAFPELMSTALAAYKPVTLTELLAHTGGVVNTTSGLTATTNLPAARLAWTDFALRQTPENARGIHYYSNTSYGMAGAMIERAWSSTYENLMATRIFTPLGMTDVGWGPTAPAGSSEQPQGHRLLGGAWSVCEGCDNLPGLSSAGTVHMPLRSWARLIRELLLADQGRSTLLTQTTARYLTTNAVPAGGGTNYGMGWSIGTGAQRFAAHDGSNVSNHSRAFVYLDAGVAFLGVTNAAELGPTGRSTLALAAMMTRLDSYWQNGR